MAKRNSFLTINKKRYILKQYVTRERKEELEKHPQSKTFKFRKCVRGFYWYVSTSSH